MNYESNPDLVRYWNCAATLKSAVRYLTRKGMDKETVVKAWKYFAKKYGFSGSIPVKRVPTTRTYSDDWEDLGDGLSYSPKLDRFYKEGTERCRLSASHNGWIGDGAILKKIINGKAI